MRVRIGFVRGRGGFGTQPCGSQLAQILEDRIGGAGDEPVVDAFQIPDKIEKKRPRFDAIGPAAAQLAEMRIRGFGFDVADWRCFSCRCLALWPAFCVIEIKEEGTDLRNERQDDGGADKPG